MTKNIFITGTDTGIGKTYVSVGLLKLFNLHGYSTLGAKPIAAGIDFEGKFNSDVVALHTHSSVKLSYNIINAFTFSLPIAPHIAAEQMQITLSVAALTEKMQMVLQHPAQIKIIEGVGGWHVPLNMTETMQDLVSALKADVVLVVGLRLGCLSQAILSSQAIKASGANLLGWIANDIVQDMPFQQENIETLKIMLDIPYLGRIRHGEKPEEALHSLTLNRLTSG